MLAPLTAFVFAFDKKAFRFLQSQLFGYCLAAINGFLVEIGHDRLMMLCFGDVCLQLEEIYIHLVSVLLIIA